MISTNSIHPLCVYCFYSDCFECNITDIILCIFIFYQQQNGFDKVLEFKHPFFQRDNPELLSQIRKIVNGSEMSRSQSENAEIVSLKSDVEELKVHLYMLSNKLVMLSNSVTQLLDAKDSNGELDEQADAVEPSSKKRKTAKGQDTTSQNAGSSSSSS